MGISLPQNEDDSNDIDVCTETKIITKFKIPVINLHFTDFNFIHANPGQNLLWMYLLVHKLHEEGLQGVKHAGGASQNKIYLWLHVCLVGINTVHPGDTLIWKFKILKD